LPQAYKLQHIYVVRKLVALWLFNRSLLIDAIAKSVKAITERVRWIIKFQHQKLPSEPRWIIWIYVVAW